MICSDMLCVLHVTFQHPFPFFPNNVKIQTKKKNSSRFPPSHWEFRFIAFFHCLKIYRKSKNIFKISLTKHAFTLAFHLISAWTFHTYVLNKRIFRFSKFSNAVSIVQNVHLYFNGHGIQEIRTDYSVQLLPVKCNVYSISHPFSWHYTVYRIFSLSHSLNCFCILEHTHHSFGIDLRSQVVQCAVERTSAFLETGHFKHSQFTFAISRPPSLSHSLIFVTIDQIPNTTHVEIFTRFSRSNQLSSMPVPLLFSSVKLQLHTLFATILYR